MKAILLPNLMAILLALSLLVLAGCSGKSSEADGYRPLTEEEVGEALKDALARSIALSAASASRTDGFNADPRLRIELPEGTRKMQNTLRKIGLGAQIDRTVIQINRAAEAASAKAKPLFIKSITAMDIDDPFDVLKGEQDAATRYLSDDALGDLYDRFEPILAETLSDTTAAQYYGDLARRYNDLPLTYDVDADLVEYVAEKTVDGLFILMALEEARIRSTSSARRTRQMKRVFGSLD